MDHPRLLGRLILLQYLGFKNPSFYAAGPDLSDGILPLQSRDHLPTTADAVRGGKFLSYSLAFWLGPQ